MTTLAALSLHFPFVWYGFLLLFGLALGSFYNVVIYRLPRMLTQTADDERITLSTPGSSCPQCRQPIAWRDNIPLLSFLWLGRPRHNAAEVMGIIGDIKGKTCIINDDMIDTAGTLCANVKELKAMGAGDIYVCATHGIFSGPAIERLNDAPIVECLVTDAIPVEVGGKIKTISVAEEFAQAISAVYHEEPVSTLVGGDFAL